MGKKHQREQEDDDESFKIPSDFEYVTDDGEVLSDDASVQNDDSDRSTSSDANSDNSDKGSSAGSESSDEEDSSSAAGDSDSEDDGDAAGVFEDDGNLETDHLTEKELTDMINSMKENNDVELALKFIVSILRTERKDAPLPPIQFSRTTKEATELIYDCIEILKKNPEEEKQGEPASSEEEEACVRATSQPPTSREKPHKYYKVFWRELSSYLTIVSSAHHPFTTALLVSLDARIMESIWLLKKSKIIEPLWVKIWTGAMSHAQPDFCPPVLSGFLKTFTEKKRVKMMVSILRKTMGIISRHFSIRKAANKIVETAKHLSSHLAAVLFELCQRGLCSEVYISVSASLKFLISQITRYSSLLSRPPSGNSNTVKKNKITISKLHDEVISWGTLTTLGTIISLMMLEKKSSTCGASSLSSGASSPCDGESIVFDPSPQKFAEVILAILFALLRLNKIKPSYIPFQMKVLGLCLALMRATELYCPLGTIICDFGDCVSVCISGQKTSKLVKKQTNLTKTASLSNILISPDDQISHAVFHENIVAAFKDLLVDYLCLLAHHPAFPEVSHILMTTANKKYKTTVELAKIVKSLIPVVQATASQIQKLRQPLKDKTFTGVEITLNIIPEEQYNTLDLIRFASNRTVNNAIFIF